MMKIADFKAKMELAKQVQANGDVNPNIRDMVGQMMIVTFLLAGGSALDSFHTVAVERASELIHVLGESGYPAPLMMEIKEMETKRGMRMYAALLDFYDPDHKLSLMELDEPDEEADVPPVEPPANGQATT